MLSKIRERAQSEKGFTLIELLVVILIIGILAAIALPAFLGQRAKAQDSSAKSDVRNLVSQAESYYTEGDTYAGFAGANSGLTIGADEGEVEIVAVGEDSFTFTAHSKSGNTFTMEKDAAGGVVTRSCTADGNAGCNESWTGTAPAPPAGP